ncbi:class I SAM-dependent methyltransferase [Granulicella mallensis]|uniref:Methyltransferase type 11 n=1 Tax=Granulicella mallensis (strain ATCC BAA-1857 / DSM 23137 / MP5ACTX8) TaxID=682795 RepID=G8P0Y3_GRAMM|nr:class I SAM-dependent methyltransferase [Granulicella mallensis]AEU35830.1 Methyltransferase type 11 [Granulicella mallensis MP5ACTX8]
MPENSNEATWDPVWEEIFQRKEWGKYPPEHVVRFVARNFYRATERSGVRILEIGCGPGANVWFMAREGFAVSGIDGSSTAIQKAGQRLSNEGLAADLRVGDFAQLPWPDASFDGVVENVSLYTNPLNSIQRALREVHRVLKPGAPFLSSSFSDRTWGYGLGEWVEPDSFTNIQEGPIAGTGFCFFLKREKVPGLFQDFSDVTIERISQTLDGEQHLVEQIVVTCRKPGK